MKLLKTNLLYVSLLSLIIGGASTLIIEHKVVKANPDADPSTDRDPRISGDNYTITGYNSTYKFIRPILSVEPVNEFEKYSGLKKNIEDYIANEKQKGLTSASVYFREFTKGQWFGINLTEKYDPGSLLKVGVLITYLRMAETDKELLKKEIEYHAEKGFQLPEEHFQSESVSEGGKYTINELLRFMIAYSDNKATLFLEDHMDTTVFKNEFSDMGMTPPRFSDPNYRLNAKEYSMLFKALFNAGYLRKRASETALSLLSESVFKEGLLKGLPQNLTVAHKFGEFGNGNMSELHECGIIYLGNTPYLLNVMTRGNDWNQLSDFIGHISKTVYDFNSSAQVN